jgi:small-conductance mechanosensitive channel
VPAPEANSDGAFARWLGEIHGWLVTPLFPGAEPWLNARTILLLFGFCVVLVWFSGWVKRLLMRRLFPRMHMDPGQAEALGAIARYVVVVLGLFVALSTVGIDLSSISVIFGALGVGIGFSLQAVTSNFFSGIVILLERPIQVGDRIQVGNLNGQVMRIRLRATEVLTNDEIMVIVPNTEFILHQVVNSSRGGDRIRVHVPIGVAYGSDVEEVKRALLEAAGSVSGVLKDPGPGVRLVKFGESSIDFELLCWTKEFLQRPHELTSQVNFALYRSLAQHGIAIPFPQRELRLSAAEPLRVDVAEKRGER